MNVVGVVIGLGAYQEGARLAAKRNEEMTGLEFRVIDTRPLQVAEEEFAGYAKLFVFENFEADVIVYLDADLVLLREWDMSNILGRPELVAVLDRYMADYPHWDPEVARSTYFNSGFFVVNRTHHAELFDRAIQTWRDGVVKFGLRDQSALNHAVRLSCAPLHLIDERFNFLRYHLRDSRDRAHVVGAHFTPHGYQFALSRLIELSASSS